MSLEDENVLKEASVEFQTILRWILSGLIQALFIVCWVVIQWVVNRYIVIPYGADFTGIDRIVLIISQWIFGITTLAPIVFFVVRLLVTMGVRTYRDIQGEIRK